MKIGNYSFGYVEVDGEGLRKDIMVVNGRLIKNWWRDQGHLVQLCDLDAVLDASPHTLVVGTGSSGRLKIADGLSAELGKRGIRLEAIPTELAIMRFEELCGMEGEENIALALHLTC
jgi:hypothetical protein